MQLQIRSQLALIGLEINKPFLHLRTTMPKVELQIKKPEIKIHSPRPVLHIDQTQCFADAGKRTPSDFAAYYAEMAWSDSMEGIARRAQEGDMLAQIHKGYTIEKLAAQNLGEIADFNVTAIPKQPPRVWFDTYPVQFEFDPGYVETRLQMGTVEGNLQWGKVNIYLRQKNYLEINWVENSKVDLIA